MMVVGIVVGIVLGVFLSGCMVAASVKPILRFLRWTLTGV